MVRLLFHDTTLLRSPFKFLYIQYHIVLIFLLPHHTFSLTHINCRCLNLRSQLKTDEMEIAALDFDLISPIPIRRTLPETSADVFLTDSLYGQTTPRRISPQVPQHRPSLRHAGTKRLQVSQMQRSDMSREVYHILKTHLPASIRDATSLPELIMVSRAIEKKLYQSAASDRAYLDLSTLNFRIAALACAVLIHAEERTEQAGTTGTRSDTCSRLLAAARSSLTHCAMVLVSYELRQIEKRFAPLTNNSLDLIEMFSG
ncbi:hypothetical protein HJC23_003317 [Cyclotella cryptica]|uniref:Cyclin N-terminal domain-containing protein n=1 Tax=Cyclotella cryptica TaxID=29204 RepID=A0ABD3QXA5_9STRA|eukprot:CCRYP_000877-RA/>CCRYP_000877-RA protein AED:0.16 eAED:0.16 QI:32/1/1/1/0.5/0.33/3/2460/257